MNEDDDYRGTNLSSAPGRVHYEIMLERVHIITPEAIYEIERLATSNP